MSISRISLKNFVIVRSLDLELAAGFTSLTGETGAGKSILVDAVQLALGQRGDASMVYEGSSLADIAVEFDQPAAAQAWLAEAGFETEQDSLLLRRTIDSKGKSRAWINGSAATLTQLRQLGSYLVDIHGQHAWAALSQSGHALQLLDEHTGIDRQPLQAAWQDWQAATLALTQAREQQAHLADERERLDWQLQEVGKLQPQDDEWEALNSEHNTLNHMQDLREAATTAQHALDADRGACQQLETAVQVLEAQLHVQSQFEPLHQDLSSALALAQDAAHHLRSLNRQLQADPERLQELDQRVSLWISLARRYKTLPEELPALVASWRNKRAELERAADLEGLEQTAQHAEQHFRQLARTISRQRHAAAPKLATAITAAMQDLGMPGGQLQLALETCPAHSAGLDRAELRIAGHAGVTPKPLAKIASGGELSRIALAIAAITANSDAATTLIFDEVDSGIGGTVAHSVGRLMQQLGQSKQVLAVTHLAQVAACAHQQLRVHKTQVQGQTESSVTALNAEERQAEIARMLSGSSTAHSLAHAQELLQQTP